MVGSTSELRVNGRRIMELISGQTLGRYEITGYLGAGGMGVVYRALDSQLGREVAVKILNEDAASSPSRIERFEREARAVARLSHPNILDIHDFGTHEGITYAVTELLHGQTLADRLRKGEIPLNKALEICRAIAEGLAAAHSEGIVHRDLKPSNIFITDTGQVKILDFGIARLKERPADKPSPSAEAPTESLTGVGKMIGTVGYMSPEQIEGKEADARSDIFGLGCVMYEILTNRRAFRGETANDTMFAILGKDPEPIADLRPEVPQAVERVVQRCLEKQPGERFESAREVASALQALSWDRSGEQESPKPPKSPRRRVIEWAVGILAACAVLVAIWFVITHGAPPPLPEHLRLVVLPFEAEGDDGELALFAAGLTETITEDLCIFEGLEGGIDWVVPRHILASNSVQSLADAHRTFNNTIAITGRLRRDGSNVRLTLAAIEPAGETRLRRAQIEYVPGNVHSLQQTPALQIAGLVDIEVDSATRNSLVGSSTTMMGAWDAYVRARGLLATAEDGRDVEAAILLLAEAVGQDPLFTSGHLAEGRACVAMFEATNDERWIERGLEHAQRASQLDGRADEAWRVIGALHRAAGRRQDALAAFETAVKLQPKNAEAWIDRGMVHQDLKQYDDAETSFERALYLRPGYWPDHDALAKLYIVQGKYEAAAIQFRHVTECVPEFAVGYAMLGGVSMYLEKTEAARELFERSLELEPTYAALSNLGTLHFEASRFADAAAMYELALEKDQENYVLWGNLAYAYMFGDQSDQAEATFTRAVELAEAQRSQTPDDLSLRADIADYYAMLGETSRGRDIIEQVVVADPSNPQLIAWIAEVFEDLGEREQALEWVGRSFAAGIPPSKFEGRPTLRGLVADERYQALVEQYFGAL
jgi:serine/threonine protein kinase/tetratricopeptide (TPR) repeat protein